MKRPGESPGPCALRRLRLRFGREIGAGFGNVHLAAAVLDVDVDVGIAERDGAFAAWRTRQIVLLAAAVQRDVGGEGSADSDLGIVDLNAIAVERDEIRVAEDATLNVDRPVIDQQGFCD